MITHPALVESVYKDIPKLSPSRLSTVSSSFGISEVSDFMPSGDKTEKSISWPIISRAVLARDGYACRICGQSSLAAVDSSNHYDKLHFKLEVHHIVPRKDLGTDSFKNLVTLCEECHHKTFSNSYGGVPVNMNRDLFSFEKSIIFALPPDMVEAFNAEKKVGILQDYQRALDPEENEYRLIHVPNSRLRIVVAPMVLQDYRKLVSEIVAERDVKDYVTITVNIKGVDSRVRALVDSGNALIL